MLEDYKSALRAGQRAYRARIARGQSPYLAVLDDVLKGLEQNLKPGAFYSSRDMLVTIARFIGKKVDTMRPEEASAARVLADGIENQKM